MKTSRGFGKTEFRTTIKSDFGDERQYETVQLGSMKGFVLAPKVTRVFIEPVGEILTAIDLKSLLKAGQGAAQAAVDQAEGDNRAERIKNASESVGLQKDNVLESLMSSNIKPEKIAAALSALATGIEKEGGVQLMLSMFEHTYVTVDGQKMNVSKNFDKLYQGNYGEAIRALVWVIQVNFGPALGNLFTGLGGVIG